MADSGIDKNIAPAKFAFTSTQKMQRSNCYYYDQPAKPELALDVRLHDPKSAHWRGKIKRWVEATIEVPRCEACYEIDRKQRQHTLLITISAFVMGFGCFALGSLVSKYHQSDALPVILGGLGLFISLILFTWYVLSVLK